MKFRTRQIAIADDGPDMTPMLDIVFILLIFFIVTSVFLDETAINLTSPPDSRPTCDPCGPTIQVYVDADNKIAVKPTQLGNVSFAVEGLLAEKPNASIVLSAHYNAHLDPIVRVKDQMALSGRKAVLRIVKD